MRRDARTFASPPAARPPARGIGRTPSVGRVRLMAFGFGFERLVTLALVLAESLVFLSVKECGFVPMLRITWFVFAHFALLPSDAFASKRRGASAVRDSCVVHLCTNTSPTSWVLHGGG